MTGFMQVNINISLLLLLIYNLSINKFFFVYYTLIIKLINKIYNNNKVKKLQ